MSPRSRSRLATRALAAGLGLGLATTATTVVLATPAQAADPVTIQLLNINDFHGRIDANTTKFATTVEQLRAAAGEANTLFLSAGDNIGASLFASSVADDQPTIDVLDALDLAASAVGNHEFDRGFADLTGRVADAADFTYLGANVYRAGTRTPALDAYDTFEVAGVTVGVIGAVTEETPSLVTPTGVAGLEFGDPVEAVNRVAAELSDGNAANGEADVIVAEYHEGASAGAPDGSTLEEEVAGGGAFAAIVNQTSAEVDAIFTGHTHKTYAWDAPVPGGTGTRPIVQTGSYGENVGQITLTVDRETGDVTAYTKANVARAAAEVLTFPRVAAVKAIVDAALANAAAIGNQPIATITDDITTAYSGGSYVDGEYVGSGPTPTTGRDDRASESTLGGLVANALWEGVSDFADPDLGITNPGGLRAELLFAGDTAGNPANTDGVVTFAEANAVLPFNNTVAIVRLTGAQIDAVLEQQWQTNADGTIPSRPYLQLGLSENVTVTADPEAPMGQRITSVSIDGQPLDPSKTYTVSTLSFLAAGGDNFRAFNEGTYTDTGLLDAELWRDYLADNDPISPDFARQQVEVSGSPQVMAASSSTVSLSKLDLTSLGSPANTSVTATAVRGSRTVELGEFPVVDGSAELSLDVPAGFRGGTVRVVAEPSGTVVLLPIVSRFVKAKAVLQVKKSTNRAVAGKTKVRLQIRVKAQGDPATGRVTVKAAGKTYNAELNKQGRATVRLKPFLKVGKANVRVTYQGDELTRKATRTVKVKVVQKK